MVKQMDRRFIERCQVFAKVCEIYGVKLVKTAHCAKIICVDLGLSCLNTSITSCLFISVRRGKGEELANDSKD